MAKSTSLPASQAAELDEHISRKPTLITNSFKVLWESAAMRLGYILTPRPVPLKEPHFRDLVSLPLANPILNNSRIHVVTRVGRHLSPVAERLLRHAVKAFPRD